MNRLEAILGEALYNALLGKAVSLSVFDKIILKTCLEQKTAWADVPHRQQKHFLEVGMAVVKALAEAQKAPL